jgi:outer membrane cobalamin receptor
VSSEAAGERSWDGIGLDPYRVLNVSASLSIMSARVSFDFNNILDAAYETVSGFQMPRRHYLIGVFWELFD